jgi:hypothetical protein
MTGGWTADIYNYSRDRPWTLGPLGYSSAMSVTDIAGVRTISVRCKEVSALFAIYQSMKGCAERETDGEDWTLALSTVNPLQYSTVYQILRHQIYNTRYRRLKLSNAKSKKVKKNIIGFCSVNIIITASVREMLKL